MDELQDIFVNEILQNKQLALPQAKPVEQPLKLPSSQINEVEQKNGHKDEKNHAQNGRPESDSQPKTNNLLLNILNK